MGIKDPFESLGLVVDEARYAILPIWTVISLVMGGFFASYVARVVERINLEPGRPSRRPS